ncbi:Hypothetical_protein [Hexamita inflata]|uniref:Hypothetical_protein n=1 Tax=Hexamita inflata TaxID=28002 RepID=A0AA86U8U2_9EUKA|nr:Hypothetical protein HINF_LOCUS33389 [Hexamita inflata]
MGETQWLWYGIYDIKQRNQQYILKNVGKISACPTCHITTLLLLQKSLNFTVLESILQLSTQQLHQFSFILFSNNDQMILLKNKQIFVFILHQQLGHLNYVHFSWSGVLDIILCPITKCINIILECSKSCQNACQYFQNRRQQLTNYFVTIFLGVRALTYQSDHIMNLQTNKLVHLSGREPNYSLADFTKMNQCIVSRNNDLYFFFCYIELSCF